jgi:hypothetical protein
MSQNFISEDRVITLHRALEKEIEAELGKDKKRPGLQLEILIVGGFIATKTLLPILCGFVSRLLYDKYKGLQTTQEAEHAKRELLQSQISAHSEVPREEVLRDMTSKLAEDGIGSERAQKLVERTIDRVAAGDAGTK